MKHLIQQCCNINMHIQLASNHNMIKILEPPPQIVTRHLIVIRAMYGCRNKVINLYAQGSTFCRCPLPSQFYQYNYKHILFSNLCFLLDLLFAYELSSFTNSLTAEYPKPCLLTTFVMAHLNHQNFIFVTIVNVVYIDKQIYTASMNDSLVKPIVLNCADYF